MYLIILIFVPIGKRSGATKIQNSDSEEERKDKANPMRKLTRSLSMRRTKQQPKQDTYSESDGDLEDDKMLISKSPAKKPAPSNLNATKSKVKRESIGISSGVLSSIKSRPVSPITQTEKKCPIEGCDSSGHLSGNLDKHFLSDACPIYHNMSASECKERDRGLSAFPARPKSRHLCRPWDRPPKGIQHGLGII